MARQSSTLTATLAALTVILLSASDGAAIEFLDQALKPFKASSIAAVSRTLASWAKVDVVGMKCTFKKDKRLTCCGKKKPEARWKINSIGYLKTTPDFVKGCGSPDQPTGGEESLLVRRKRLSRNKSYSIDWEVYGYSKQALKVRVLASGYTTRRGSAEVTHTFGLIRPDGDPDSNHAKLFLKEAVLGLSPGSKDRKLFDSVKADLASWDGKLWGEQFVGFNAKSPSADNPFSTIYHRKEYRKKADALVERLKPLLGVGHTVQRENMAYDVLIVVGTDKYRTPPLKVKLIDGLCTKKAAADCKNDLLDRVNETLKAQEDYQVVDVSRASNARTTKLEVMAASTYYHPRIKAMLSKHLTELLAGSDGRWPPIQDWKWGGKFEVVLIIGPEDSK